MPSFHERYLAGEYEPVWDDLLALGPHVRDAPYYDDAVAVARETMQRVRRNCEVLIPRLEHLGWQFGYDWADVWGNGSFPREVQWEPPRLGQPADTSRLDAIEARNGLLPIALRAFYEIVGAINFVGSWKLQTRPGWPESLQALDPLYVAGVERAFQSDYTPISLGFDESKHAYIASDQIEKYNTSGGPPYYIKLPSEAADSLIVSDDDSIWNEDREVTLVWYLRDALRAGGFLAFDPGWAQEPVPDADLAYLTAGLESI